uniref:Uncharacterized protein n=1 Tax=Panstrongylus lignarius TaxID=156445 RepID=A0A224XMG6_9HEMI
MAINAAAMVRVTGASGMLAVPPVCGTVLSSGLLAEHVFSILASSSILPVTLRLSSISFSASFLRSGKTSAASSLLKFSFSSSLKPFSTLKISSSIFLFKLSKSSPKFSYFCFKLSKTVGHFFANSCPICLSLSSASLPVATYASCSLLSRSSSCFFNSSTSGP